MNTPGNLNLHAPVFILGCHKSGTTLLRSLLDGHEEFATMPRETHFFQYAGYPVQYPLRRVTGRNDPGVALWDRIGPELEKLQNRTLSSYGDSADFAGYDLATLKRFMEHADSRSPKEEFCSYMNALSQALSRDYPHWPPGRRIVEKSVEHAEFAGILRAWFPDSRFIHIVRNPYSTLAGIRRMKVKQGGGYPWMRDICRSMQVSYHHLLRDFRLMDGYMAIRYEDLVSDTEATMGRVADFLDIPFRETLLEPTMLGMPWRGNSTTMPSRHSGKGSGVRKQGVNDTTDVSAFEISLANKFASPTLVTFGYDRLVASKVAALRRCAGEDGATYLRNRALLLNL